MNKNSVFIVMILALVGVAIGFLIPIGKPEKQEPFSKGEPQKPQWLNDDYNDAVSKAKEENKDIFVMFTGAWCPPCRALKKEILSTEEFEKHTQNKFIYLNLWIPPPPEHDEALSEKHFPSKETEELMNKYGVKGFPTIILMNTDGYDYGKLRYDGNTTVKSFLKEMDNALSRREKIIADFNIINNENTTQEELAKVYARLFDLRESIGLGINYDMIKKAIESDPEFKILPYKYKEIAAKYKRIAVTSDFIDRINNAQRKQDYEEMLAVTTEAVSSPDLEENFKPVFFENHGLILIALNRFDNAVKFGESLLHSDSEDEDIRSVGLKIIIETYHRQKLFDKAIQAINDALKIPFINDSEHLKTDIINIRDKLEFMKNQTSSDDVETQNTENVNE